MPVGLNPLPKLLPVKGVKLSAISAGLRYSGRPDLVLIACDEQASVASVFTLNRYAAAPVIVARQNQEKAKTRALIINAGQANAGTGKPGIAVAQTVCDHAAQQLGCQPAQVLPFSTGIIGDAPSVEKIDQHLPELVSDLAEDNWNAAAHGIMTTDTIAKGTSQSLDVDGAAVTVTGIVKGSGMIHPNMATLLSFSATDAAIDQDLLGEMWTEVVARTFNRISVDGDTSTNDAAVIIASGKAGNRLISNPEDAGYNELKSALMSVCSTLAQAVIRDAEGATKFATINVTGGRSEEDCLAVAFTIAHSPLVKTALFASDPNWGRILAAVGRAPIEVLDIDSVDLFLDEVCVAKGGAIYPGYTEEQGQTVMNRAEIRITVNLNAGTSEATVWTSDLSHEYVKINAEYRS